MSSFFAGNDKLILVKKQVDKDTPITDWTTATALKVYEFAKPSPRAIAALEETDASADEGASHVTAIQPQISFGVYGRPSELALIAEALLGDNDDSATASPTTHEATLTQDMPYYGILVVDPYENTRFDGCRLSAGQFTAQDTGQTELRVTGLSWVPIGITHGISTPSPVPTPSTELPFIFAECTVKYDGASEGRTSQFTVNVNRNVVRAQGDNGFEALDVVPTKRSVDASVTRYVSDADAERAVDTGSAAGTDPTATIFTQAFSVLFNRGAGVDNRQFLIAVEQMAFETHEKAVNTNGEPLAEVIGIRRQPSTDFSIVTVNSKTTP